MWITFFSIFPFCHVTVNFLILLIKIIKDSLGSSQRTLNMEEKVTELYWENLNWVPLKASMIKLTRGAINIVLINLHSQNGRVKLLVRQAFIHTLLSTTVSPKDSVPLLFALSLKIAGKCIFLEFFLGFYNFIGSFNETLTRKIHATFLYECL